MMNALTKSFERSNALINTSHTSALQLKAAGVMDRMVSPSMSSSPADWQQQGRNRENYAMFRSWVYAAINALASEAASQPVNVGQMKGVAAPEEEEGTEKRQLSRTKSLRDRKQMLLDKMPKQMRIKAANAELEVLPDHELIDILERPNPLQHRYQFVYSFVANLNLTGRAYIIRDEDKGKPQFYSLPSTWVRPDHSDGPYSKFFVANPRDMDFASKTKPLDASQVAMAYLPNPADPMGAISPASSQAAAIRVDDRIQVCEEKFFDNGIFPSVVVTVGKDPHPDVPGGVRPRLTGTQRRQVVGAIRRVMGSVANYGNPAIVDGLIENIVPFSRTQSDIGWEKSEATLKTRILSAFCVHPFILGEPVGVGGYAQTYVIRERFCDRLNVFLDLLSTLMTQFATVSLKGKEKQKADEMAKGNKILVWWEQTKPRDPSLDWSNLRFARENGDVSSSEFRAKLGLPPDEDKAVEIIPPKLLGAISPILSLIGSGLTQPDQAQALLEAIGVPVELAQRIVGAGTQEEYVQEATEELKRAIKLMRQDPTYMADAILKRIYDGASTTKLIA